MSTLSPTNLSPTMAVAMREAINHGGELIRLPGAYWTWEGCPVRYDGRPNWWADAVTVKALVTRGALEYTGWKDRTSHQATRGAAFPVRVKVRMEWVGPRP